MPPSLGFLVPFCWSGARGKEIEVHSIKTSLDLPDEVRCDLHQLPACICLHANTLHTRAPELAAESCAFASGDRTIVGVLDPDTQSRLGDAGHTGHDAPAWCILEESMVSMLHLALHYYTTWLNVKRGRQYRRPRRDSRFSEVKTI